MKSKQTIESFFAPYKTILTVIGSTIVTVTTLYGVFSFFDNRTERINDAVPRKELMEVVKKQTATVDSIRNQNKEILQGIVLLDQKVTNVGEEVISHIRKSQEIPPDERIEDILNLTQYIYKKVYNAKTLEEAYRISIEEFDSINKKRN